jgi:hypothetical protein
MALIDRKLRGLPDQSARNRSPHRDISSVSALQEMCLKGKTDQTGGMGSRSALVEHATTDYSGIYRCRNCHHPSTAYETTGFGDAHDGTRVNRLIDIDLLSEANKSSCGEPRR